MNEEKEQKITRLPSEPKEKLRREADKENAREFAGMMKKLNEKQKAGLLAVTEGLLLMKKNSLS